MGKGKLANIGAIMHAMRETTPEVAKSVSEYLSKRTQVSYDKMEVKLKAMGYTVEQYFKSLEENSSSREFIESYHNTVRCDFVACTIGNPDGYRCFSCKEKAFVCNFSV